MHIKSFISNEIEQAEQDYNKNSITVVSLSATPVIQNTQYKHLITVVYTPKLSYDGLWNSDTVKVKSWPEELRQWNDPKISFNTMNTQEYLDRVNKKE